MDTTGLPLENLNIEHMPHGEGQPENREDKPTPTNISVPRQPDVVGMMAILQSAFRSGAWHTDPSYTPSPRFLPEKKDPPETFSPAPEETIQKLINAGIDQATIVRYCERTGRHAVHCFAEFLPKATETFAKCGIQAIWFPLHCFPAFTKNPRVAQRRAESGMREHKKYTLQTGENPATTNGEFIYFCPKCHHFHLGWEPGGTTPEGLAKALQKCEVAWTQNLGLENKLQNPNQTQP